MSHFYQLHKVKILFLCRCYYNTPHNYLLNSRTITKYPDHNLSLL